MKKILLTLLILLLTSNANAYKLFGLFEIGSTTINTGTKIIVTPEIQTQKLTLESSTDFIGLSLPNNTETIDFNGLPGLSTYNDKLTYTDKNGVSKEVTLGSDVIRDLNSDLVTNLSILPTNLTLPRESVFGYTLTDQNYVHDPANGALPYLAATNYESSKEYYQAVAFVNSGASVAWSDESIYTHDLFTSVAGGTLFTTIPTIENGYMYYTYSDEDINAFGNYSTNYALPTGIKKIDIIGNINVNGSGRTSVGGRIYSTVGIYMTNIGSLLQVGFEQNAGNGSSSKYIAKYSTTFYTSNTNIDTTPSTYRISMTKIDDTKITIQVYINNELIIDLPENTDLGDLVSVPLKITTFVGCGANAATGAAVMKNYGMWVFYELE